MSLAKVMNEMNVGERYAIRKTISESDVYLYAGIVGDFHPNHTDETYARTHLGRRVAHGAMLPGFVSRATVEMIGDRLTPPGYAAQEFLLKFISPVFMGDTIEVSVEVVNLLFDRRKVIIKSEIINQDGMLCAFGNTTVKVLKDVRFAQDQS